jgi:hypothetical protein
MKDYLRKQGILLETEYDLIPAVAARVPMTGDVAAIVLRLRANPNVDYVEPILPGTRFQQLGSQLHTALPPGDIGRATW